MSKKEKKEFDRDRDRGSMNPNIIPWKSMAAFKAMQDLQAFHVKFFAEKSVVDPSIYTQVPNSSKELYDKEQAARLIPGPFSNSNYGFFNRQQSQNKPKPEKPTEPVPPPKMKVTVKLNAPKKTQIHNGCCAKTCLHHEDISMYYKQYLEDVTYKRFAQYQNPGAFALSQVPDSTLKVMSNIEEHIPVEIQRKVGQLYPKHSLEESLKEIRSIAQIKMRLGPQPKIKVEKNIYMKNSLQFLQKTNTSNTNIVSNSKSVKEVSNTKNLYIPKKKLTTFEEEKNEWKENFFLNEKNNPFPPKPKYKNVSSEVVSQELQNFKLAEIEKKKLKNPVKEFVTTRSNTFLIESKPKVGEELHKKKKVILRKKKQSPLVQSISGIETRMDEISKIPLRTGSGFNIKNEKGKKYKKKLSKVVNKQLPEKLQKSDSKLSVKMNDDDIVDNQNNGDFYDANGKFDLKLYQQSVMRSVEISGQDEKNVVPPVQQTPTKIEEPQNDEIIPQPSEKKVKRKKRGKPIFPNWPKRSDKPVSIRLVPNAPDKDKFQHQNRWGMYERKLAAGDLFDYESFSIETSSSEEEVNKLLPPVLPEVFRKMDKLINLEKIRSIQQRPTHK